MFQTLEEVVTSISPTSFPTTTSPTETSVIETGNSFLAAETGSSFVVAQTGTSTIVGLSIGLGICVFLLSGAAFFAYLLYRVPG